MGPTSPGTRDPEHRRGLTQRRRTPGCRDPRGPSLPAPRSGVLALRGGAGATQLTAKGQGLTPFLHFSTPCGPRQVRTQGIWISLSHSAWSCRRWGFPPKRSFQEHQGKACTGSWGAANLPRPPAGRQPAPTPANGPDPGGARSRRSPRLPRCVAEARCAFPRSSGLASASAITAERAGACVQAPPRRDYWGLDRKPRLSLLRLPRSSAVSKPARCLITAALRGPGD